MDPLPRTLLLVVFLLSLVLILAGVLVSEEFFLRLAPWVSQTGSSNPKILEKVRLLPLLSVVLGIELLVAGLMAFLGRSHWNTLFRNFLQQGTSQKLQWSLLVVFGGISVLSVNFGLLHRILRLKASAGRSQWEIKALDLGRDYDVIHAVQRMTPETAGILIKTNRPLQYLVNFELYPRRFYVHPDRNLPVTQIPDAWFERRHIEWTLEINDSGALEFELRQITQNRR